MASGDRKLEYGTTQNKMGFLKNQKILRDFLEWAGLTEIIGASVHHYCALNELRLPVELGRV